jgi:hypothetical protein|tara:strand:- start:1202 stop:1768 length:567 start_codon:yes stop_codon:yes gene_type:complete
MATTAISNFKTALAFGGARPSLFDVKILPPTSIEGLGALTKSQYQCRVSEIPGLTVTPIDQQYFGRITKIPGEISFAGTLSTTFINPEDYGCRTALETWTEYLNGSEDNLYAFGKHTEWSGKVQLRQYTKDGQSAIDYNFEDCWPSVFSTIDLSYDTAAALEEYTVTWTYNYYTTSVGATSTALGNQV